ncbi:AAA family ATPase [Candidatus Spongiihabitans sp.]|uniref:AAA family ATPase n=1 Tax=Candidatus Spongiihabitans sp. TaxID=3101308 RepID=UPI003C79C16D
MYTKKIKVLNYGPIEDVDITFPFNGDNPKPILLVGENGSGKSILLSHIVNGLMAAQGSAYPGSSEVEKGKVYKIRSPSYIKSHCCPINRQKRWSDSL